MRCPHHFKDPKIEIEPEGLNLIHIEVVACCEEFENQVCEALRNNLDAAGDEFLYDIEGFGSIRFAGGWLDFSQRSGREVAQLWLLNFRQRRH